MFMPGDKVWYKESGSGPRQGPYLVVPGPTATTYRLANVNDVTVLVYSGKVITENELERAVI